MQVNSTDQSLGSLLGQFGPRRANASQSRRQSADFEACIGRGENGSTSAERMVRDSGAISSQTSRSNTGTGVPPSGTSGADASAADTTMRGVAEPVPVTTSAALSASKASSPFAPSAPNEPSPAAPWPVNIVTPSTLPAVAHESKAALADAMVKQGLDPSQYQVSYWEELVWYPGGNYINKFLTVQGPDGQKTDFDAAWTLKTPWVTATTLKGQSPTPAT